MTIDSLIEAVKSYNSETDEALIRLAFDFAAEAHQGKKRANGDDTIVHNLGVAMYLAEFKVDDATIIGGLLHDLPEDTGVGLEEIEKNFGEEIALLVAGVTQLGRLKYRGIERYAENLRAMFVAMARDLRIVVIKFADRLHNLETLSALPEEKQQRIAREVLEIYAPIANRLGMSSIKSRLEDVAFQYVYPEDYARLRAVIDPLLAHSKEYLVGVEKEARMHLEEANIPVVKIESRVKHLYSIYKKLAKKKTFEVDGLYDLIALRIVVPTVGDCYAAFGVIHQFWKPFPGRIKDYIAQPKANNYRALHTTVFCEGGEVVEFQIRTTDMDREAKFGVAAHWHYDESGKQARSALEKPEWLQEVLDLQQEQNQEFLDTVQCDIFQDRIFVFTPKGDVINLPEGSAVIDFAYRIHTDVGRRCIGAKINGTMVSLDRVVESGDVVEIMTDKNRKKPNPDWIKFAKTGVARAHIRSQLRATE